MAELVTLFGGGGFLGRYVAQALLKRGMRVRIVERDPKNAFFVKPQGGLGQTQFIAADVTKPATVTRAVAGADAVVNLVGILTGPFQAVHVEGARNVAQAAAEAGAKALVHVSAIGADPSAPSAYARSKGEGEAAVRGAFPAATIMRPSIVFGPEDDFINRFAGMMAAPVVPVMAPATRFQPVYVADVARAIAAAAQDPAHHGGQTYELAGPEVLSMAELNRQVAQMIGRAPHFIELPDGLSSLIASFGFLPGAPLTKDQWQMLKRDNVASEGTPGLEALGIHPTPLNAVARGWLVRFRKHGRFGYQRKAS
jgi:NADH dehydrogenase